MVCYLIDILVYFLVWVWGIIVIECHVWLVLISVIYDTLGNNRQHVFTVTRLQKLLTVVPYNSIQIYYVDYSLRHGYQFRGENIQIIIYELLWIHLICLNLYIKNILK